MNKKLQTPFSTRQHMLSKDFELYYYSDTSLKRVAAHAHDYYEFYFFLEGDASMQIGGSQQALKYGDVILIPPKIMHRLHIHSTDVPYRRFVFWISREFCSRLMESSEDYGFLFRLAGENKQYIFHNDRVTFNSIQSRLICLLEELRGTYFAREAQITLCIGDLILHMNRLVYEKSHPKQSADSPLLYQNICHFIEGHIGEDLSLERLAKEFFISKCHISHVFKENLGVSVHQYIVKKRLELCRQAILGDMSINEAFLAFGFRDYSTFYRAFKREYGISPRKLQETKTTAFTM